MVNRSYIAPACIQKFTRTDANVSKRYVCIVETFSEGE